MSWFPYERDELGRWRRGSWQQTFTGQQFYALDPRVDEIHFQDMAIGLSREHRYARQTIIPYVVAEHSVYVSIQAGVLARQLGYSEEFILNVEREGLLHDGSEAWIGDMPRPLKRQTVMFSYRKAESKWEKCVFERFGIQSSEASKSIVKEIDNRIVLDEVQRLMADPGMWKRANRYPDLQPLDIEINAYKPEDAYRFFCQRFLELWPVTITKQEYK